ncbi:MAG: S8 family serine peptidase [Candidatus Heimdallarchaeota archaeon]|nr:S8 family serine peptidase [Candidatus Heimdallarchaeota archaeon]
MSDFTNESSKDFINAVVIFNEDVIWNFPDMTFTYKYKYLNGFRASIPIGMFNNFRQASFIKYIYEKDHNNASLDGNDELHYGVDNTQAERVWGGEENAVDVIPGYPAGQGAKVAVMDSGIDYYHSDLNENYKGGYDFAGYNHINDNDPMDFWDDGNKGHGTHVAGIIGAADNELDVIGVAPKVDLYALKVFGLYWDVLEARNKTYFGDDDLAMEWAIEHDMDIVSMSFGPLYFQAFHDLCDIAYSKGITLVASAGNDANDDPHYPSDYSTVIRVGAVDKYNNFASAFSNYGPYQELVAPGGKTWLQQRIKSDQLGGGTRKVSGTSQACPMVSGVCALLHSVTPDIMPDEIRYILHNTAYDRGDPGWDEYYGWGTVDAEAAVNMAQTTDSDSDGIIDLLENNVWFTNPNLPDTDGDGLNDCLEVRTYFSDPNEQDTDKDGLDDLSEANDYNTDLNDVDTDNDGYNDPIEVILDFDPLDNSHHPLQSFFYEDGVGATHSWSATDSPYNVVTPDADLEGYDCIKNHEATSHYGYYMFAESPAIDLSSWTGDNDLHITFRFRCQSNTQSSSITQFALRFYNALTQTRVFFENPTIYNYYLVHQGNRNGQTWIDGYDSGWQTISFTLLASEFSQFAGTNDRLKVQWGHVDSYSDYWYQREYLDYLQITEEENTIIPDPPRDLNGIGDGIKHIALYWKSPLNVLATKYKIQRKVEGVYTHQAEVDHVGTIYQTQYWNDPEELEFGITYYYRVNAFNDQIVGSYAYWSGTVGFGLLSNGSSIQIISSSHFESITHQLIFFELAFIFCLNLLGIVSIFNKKKSCF